MSLYIFWTNTRIFKSPPSQEEKFFLKNAIIDLRSYNDYILGVCIYLIRIKCGIFTLIPLHFFLLYSPDPSAHGHNFISLYRDIHHRGEEIWSTETALLL